MFGKKSFKNVLQSKSDSEPKTKSNEPQKLDEETTIIEDISDNIVQNNFDSEIKPTTSLTANLIQEILTIDDITIRPVVDYSTEQIIYPILSAIGESPNNVMILEDLVAQGVLDKQIGEKLIACPLHPNSISSSVRVYCPKCNSMQIEKLNLFEHKKCGHIMEGKDSGSESISSICPSCTKEIKNFEHEIKILAMWYKCQSCSEKFDDATLKIHCRKYNHDFEPNSGKLSTLFCYQLRTLHVSKNSDITQIKIELLKLLKGFNFITKQNALIKGKSQNMHEIPLYVLSSTGEMLLIFIKNKFEGINDSDINSILVTMLDVEPTRTLFVTSSKFMDGVENLAKHYHIDVISETDFSKLLAGVEEYISSWQTDKGVKK